MTYVESKFVGMYAKAQSILSVSQLRAGMKGRVITPEDTDYDAARFGLNREVPVISRPALIIRTVDEHDVSRVVLLARQMNKELAIRSGGHSLAGFSTTDGGIVLDLSEMKGLEIDVNERTAWAAGGLTAGEYTAATAQYGLATGFGDTGSVGIGGLTTGGGIGYLVRKHGLTIDSLLAVKMVTADGEIRYVDADNHPDLFWAVRGGGSNFGVVTHFKFRLHPVDTIVGGMLVLPATPQVIAGFAALAEAAPDELSAIVRVMPAPPLPFVPPEQYGQLIVLALMVYAGEVEEGLRVVAPFQQLATPIIDMIGPMPYPQIYMPEDPNMPTMAALRSKFIDKVDEQTAQVMIDQLNASTAPIRAAEFRVLGGAMSRVPSESTAFAHRASRIMASFMVLYGDRDEAAIHTGWVSNAIAALKQGEGAYVNFVADEGKARVHDAYPGATWERLAAIKAKYDPTNFFRRNHNIVPKVEKLS